MVLSLILSGCDNRSGNQGASPAAAAAAAGMSKYPYLAADGGPHMLLPVAVANSWTGAGSVTAAMSPKSDYGRACAATANVKMTTIPVGTSSAMIFQDPPMTAWGTSSDGLVEIYYLEDWSTTNLDALISKATAALPTASLTDSGKTISLSEPDAFLLFAGDTPTAVSYDLHRVTIPAGKYKILIGTYSAARESATVYRLKPAGN